MSSDTTTGDDTYVHRPGESDTDDTVGTGGSDRDITVGANEPDPQGFGRRGWILVGVVGLCFLVIPGAVYLVPSLPAMAGLPYIAAMLALPMLPALLLGLVAVWSMTAATRGDS